MREELHEPISVIAAYSASKKCFMPRLLNWAGRDYKLGMIDFQHKVRKGELLIHYFSLSDITKTVYFKLAFDTSSLAWTLEEYMDGS